MENQIEMQADAPLIYERLPWYVWDEDSDAESIAE
jgi:hypothetical protein